MKFQLQKHQFFFFFSGELKKLLCELSRWEKWSKAWCSTQSGQQEATARFSKMLGVVRHPWGAAERGCLCSLHSPIFSCIFV